MKISVLTAALLLAASPIAAAAQEAPALRDDATAETQSPETPTSPAEADQMEWAKNFLAKLQPKTGAINLPSAKAALNVPDSYYFLDAKDARAVLEEAWGNPPDDSTLGMILPEGMTPLDSNAWAATVSYINDGYVSDEDAGKTDYNKLLKDMQKNAVQENAWREKNGYPSVEIVGWAEQPTYDSSTHKFYWAKDLKFGNAAKDTLNYDIRVLGRRGVLVMSFIATMDDLPAIKQAAPAVLQMAHFDEGARYADYQPGVDKKAAYGLAGLVAGGLIAKKTGLLAALLLFGKKFIAIGIAALAGAGAWLKRQFTRNTEG